ncbi:MAG: IS1595 family transposase [Bacteroidetes bacterium]|nr:IS1595 family transposase [Bacteroidota bacterium]
MKKQRNNFTSLDYFRKTYNSKSICLQEVFKARLQKTPFCVNAPECNAPTEEFYVLNVKTGKFICKNCNYTHSATEGTIFGNTYIPIEHLFDMINTFMHSRHGWTARAMSAECGYSERWCFDFLREIRELMGKENKRTFYGFIESDETYAKTGSNGRGRNYKKKRGRNNDDKTPVMAMLQRGKQNKVIAFAVKDCSALSLIPLIEKHVVKGSTILTDEWGGYVSLNKKGYNHNVVKHKEKEWVNGCACTNNLELFFRHFKRTIRTYTCVTREYIQDYVNECVYRWNYRTEKDVMFFSLLENLPPLKFLPKL